MSRGFWYATTPLHVTPSIKYQIKNTPIRVSIRVAEYKKRKTKQIKKNSITPVTRTPGKCVLLCFLFPARRFIGGNIQRYVTMASSAVAALMLARERQRIGAQGTHEVFLAKLLEPTLVHMLVAYTIYDILLYTYIS